MCLEEEIEALTKEKNDFIRKNEADRDLGEKLSKKIACKEEAVSQLDDKISDVHEK